MVAFWKESASQLLARLARGEISAVELLDATLARIEQLNPQLNAVVALDAERAFLDAKASDERRARGEARPLDGLPITIKDGFDVAGLPCTAGAPVYRSRISPTDAVAVARLRAAGAVIMGKTNVPLMNGDWQSFNAIHGATNNPWNTDLSPGGSSGAAAASVAAGFSAFELGSDLAGSIRWPAHACGIFGLKPTFGLIPTRGQIPPPPNSFPDNELSVAGPLARSADDLELLLDVLAGPEHPGPWRLSLAPPRQQSPKGMRIAIWPEEAFAPVDRRVRRAVEKAAQLLASEGAQVEEAKPGFEFGDSFEVFSLLNHALVTAGLPPRIREKLIATADRYSPEDLTHAALQARGAALSWNEYLGLTHRRNKLKAAWRAFFEAHDAILMPPAPVPAIAHDHEPDFHARRIIVDGQPMPYFDFLLWAGPATIAQLPAVSAPVSITDDGLPLGVQIVAAYGEDRTAIAVARMLEQLTGGFRTPPVGG